MPICVINRTDRYIKDTHYSISDDDKSRVQDAIADKGVTLSDKAEFSGHTQQRRLECFSVWGGNDGVPHYYVDSIYVELRKLLKRYDLRPTIAGVAKQSH